VGYLQDLESLKAHKSFQGSTEFFQHSSSVTQTPMRFSLYRPSGVPKKGLVWLSGLTCNEENFITKAGAQKYLEAEGIVVICPDTSPRGLELPDEHKDYDFGSGAGFYLNAKVDGYKDHYQMETYINNEIYGYLDKEFGLQGNVGIFGHSMGGHGALTLGLKFPDLYKSVSAFSPIVNPMACQWGQKAFSGYLGENKAVWKNYDATELVKSGKRHPRSLRIDQGLSDNFYPEQLLTENFIRACESEKQALDVRFRDGYDHSYYFISTFVGEHIRFHSENLSNTQAR